MENDNLINEAETNKTEQSAVADISVYNHRFASPFTYEGKTYEELTFEFGKLTGTDALAIENELSTLGKMFISPEFSGEYLVRMAAKACTEPIGADVLSAMPLREYNRIRNRARSFLLYNGQ